MNFKKSIQFNTDFFQLFSFIVPTIFGEKMLPLHDLQGDREPN